MTRLITENDVEQLLDMATALAALETAHRELARGHAQDTPRERTRTPQTTLHILQGAHPAAHGQAQRSSHTGPIPNPIAGPYSCCGCDGQPLDQPDPAAVHHALAAAHPGAFDGRRAPSDRGPVAQPHQVRMVVCRWMGGSCRYRCYLDDRAELNWLLTHIRPPPHVEARPSFQPKRPRSRRRA